MESGPNIEPGYQSVMSRRLLLKNWLAKPTISTTKNEQRITKNDFTNHDSAQVSLSLVFAHSLYILL